MIDALIGMALFVFASDSGRHPEPTDFRDRFEASREAGKQKFEDEKETFKAKLETIKDDRKKALLTRLSTNCQNINVKLTDKMTEMLTKMSSILTNVTNRAASASAAGKDIASVSAAIVTARSAIVTAQTAVTAQASVPCTITFTSPTSLRGDVGKSMSSLESTLRMIYNKVMLAKKYVIAAVKAL